MKFRGIEMGDRAQDAITGLTGHVVARVEYITGCNQLLLQPECGTDATKAPDAHWFDVERVQVLERGAIRLTASPTGGPRGRDEAPKR